MPVRHERSRPRRQRAERERVTQIRTDVRRLQGEVDGRSERRCSDNQGVDGAEAIGQVFLQRHRIGVRRRGEVGQHIDVGVLREGAAGILEVDQFAGTTAAIIHREQLE